MFHYNLNKSVFYERIQRFYAAWKVSYLIVKALLLETRKPLKQCVFYAAVCKCEVFSLNLMFFYIYDV